MLKQGGWSRFELLIVASVIGLIMLIAISRYLDLAREGRRLGFELLAHNFSAAAAMTRAHWLLKGSVAARQDYVDQDDLRIYMNAEGWPITAEPISSGRPTQYDAHNCYQLWLALLQNPESASVEEKDNPEGKGAIEEKHVRGERRYHISYNNAGFCRYELATKERNSHFFDYELRSGQVRITVPAYKSVTSL